MTTLLIEKDPAAPLSRLLSATVTFSLDAPLVALVWQEAAARATGCDLNWTHRIVLFASVWLGYTADRWLDGHRYENPVSARHAFAKEKRTSILILWTVVLGLAVSLSALSFSSHTLALGSGLAALAVANALLVQLELISEGRAMAKSILTALLVALGALFFVGTEWGVTNAAVLMGVAYLAMPLFLVNCLRVHSWDRQLDNYQEAAADALSPSVGSPLTRGVALVHLASSLPILAMLGALTLTPLFVATVASHALMHLCERSVSFESRRSLADLCLLTPLIALPFL